MPVRPNQLVSRQGVSGSLLFREYLIMSPSALSLKLPSIVWGSDWQNNYNWVVSIVTARVNFLFNKNTEEITSLKYTHLYTCILIQNENKLEISNKFLLYDESRQAWNILHVEGNLNWIVCYYWFFSVSIFSPIDSLLTPVTN